MDMIKLLRGLRIYQHLRVGCEDIHTSSLPLIVGSCGDDLSTKGARGLGLGLGGECGEEECGKPMERRKEVSQRASGCKYRMLLQCLKKEGGDWSQVPSKKPGRSNMNGKIAMHFGGYPASTPHFPSFGASTEALNGPDA